MNDREHIVDIGGIGRGRRHRAAAAGAPQHGEAGVARALGYPQQVRHAVTGMERDHLDAGCHDVLRGALTQPQGPAQQRRGTARQRALFGR